MFTRNNWIRCHRYLALSAGLFFALLGLTGSLSVYREALDELLNPQLVVERPGRDYASLDRIMESVRRAHPRYNGAWTLEMPRSPRGMMTAWYEAPYETLGEYYAPLMVSVNPYTAEVVASRYWGHTATTWLLDLHTQLRLDRNGWNFVGALGLLLTISVASGLYLWWPGLARLKSAFAIRRNAGVVRLAFDLHRLVGLASATVLLLLALTGVHLSYPAVLESLAGASGMGHHGNGSPDLRSTAVPNNNPVGLAAADFIARSLFRRAELRRITTPEGDAGVYRVNFRQAGELNQAHPFTVVWVDRWSGQIKAVRNPAQFTAGQAFTTWMWPLHTGEAFGATGRFIWFLTGLTPALLFASGLLCWLHRRGVVRDRPVDVAAWLSYGRRQGGRAYGVARKVIGVAVPLALQAGRRAWSVRPSPTQWSKWRRRLLASQRYGRLWRWLRGRWSFMREL
ncbi:PepSY-associated TM helix domain-containing protein [Methylogaea oryzae]|uniref:PepSY domain-containing protein n=2 Tax=Methylogaea oryzae TaxID=1295382 RepID=A0A8D4VRP1_9GAMM|nr:PepSY-associated TM helix domain-containing protein [Methylogaea oryzae]BBL71155.1 hypothetical protein MoryE10_17610 [Methylogaea oryzae]